MKKKSCKRCLKEKPIFARGLCKSCDIVENPQKYLISKKSTKLTKITKADKSSKETITSLKKKLDAVFSIYSRNFYSDSSGNTECYTCGKKGTVKTMQCGHFHSRSHLSVRWDLDNVRNQCAGCNVFKHGNYIVYTMKLYNEIGPFEFMALEQKKNKEFKVTKDWLLEKIKEFSN
jgi:5-methylcytosine-specific restriction endonuclease McrA